MDASYKICYISRLSVYVDIHETLNRINGPLGYNIQSISFPDGSLWIHTLKRKYPHVDKFDESINQLGPYDDIWILGVQSQRIINQLDFIEILEDEV